MSANTPKTPVSVAVEVDRGRRHRAELVGQWVNHRGLRRKACWTRWNADSQLEVSFAPTGGPYYLASEMILAEGWKPLTRGRRQAFVARMQSAQCGVPDRDATAADLAHALDGGQTATLADLRRSLGLQSVASIPTVTTGATAPRSTAPTRSALPITPDSACSKRESPTTLAGHGASVESVPRVEVRQTRPREIRPQNADF